MLFKLLIFYSVTFSIQSFNFDEVKEKESFKKYFNKAYHLRFKENETTTVYTDLTKEGDYRRALIVSPEKLLKDSFERYQQTSKTEKFQKVSRNGTTEEKLDLIAEEVWDRTGADLVEKTFIVIGANVGAYIGGYVGGSLGMVIGIALPPLQVPLVIGGVFIGKNLGRVLGVIGGKIASDFVNGFIANNLISQHVIKNLYTSVKEYIGNGTNSPELTCRSDICSKGFAESKCKCVPCKGHMKYSNVDGASSCKTCHIGSFTISDYYRRNVRCSKCPVGTFGNSDGKCHNCIGAMEYGDTEGATSCKTCSLGTIPVWNYYRRNVRCTKCPAGTIGKNDGRCHKCVGSMEYGDEEGAIICKTCKPGTVHVRDYYRRYVKCSECRKGTIGKTDGFCHRCNGPMEYGDTAGATSCKTCPPGNVPVRDYNRYQIRCSQCRIGTTGKTDGFCHRCNGPMEYGDTTGATSCKTCPPGNIPVRDYNRYQIRCSQCRAGTIGKSDGNCHKCDGPKEYVNIVGATTCKICSPGTVVKSYNGFHIGCKPTSTK